MKDFLNGFSLLFDPFGAIKLLEKKEKKPTPYFLTAFDYLAQAYHVEKKPIDSQPKRKSKRTA